MENPETSISVQVCFAKPDTCFLKNLELPAGATIDDAIRQSGVLIRFSEIDLTVWQTGIYGKLKPLDTVLRDRDRIEIYRPLLADPKESRRRRAVKKDRKTSA
jgi:putative ubiquitin-RnfH superfamily antitoxin RatB of RatAB toxin-antitoxin module